MQQEVILDSEKGGKRVSQYEKPTIEIVNIEGVDIITTSGVDDNNQTGWDEM